VRVGIVVVVVVVLLLVVLVVIPAFVGEVVIDGTSYLDLAFDYSIANFVSSPSCSIVCSNALSTVFVDNVTVALSTCGGAVRFLDELQKTCVACVVLFRLATLGPIQRLFVGDIST
jgi:hypothetical protein